MSKMPPTCSDCHDADATGPDGWCDECAAMRDCDPASPDTGPRSHGWALEAVRGIFAPPSAQFPHPPAPAPAPSDTEPRYRYPF